MGFESLIIVGLHACIGSIMQEGYSFSRQFNENRNDEIFPTLYQPAESQIDDETKNRSDTWRKNKLPGLLGTNFKTITDADHWTIRLSATSRHSVDLGDCLIYICTCCRNLLMALFHRRSQGDKVGTMDELETSREGHRELCSSEVPFFLLGIPRVSLAGLHFDETHHKDAFNRVYLDTLIHERSGGNFLNKENYSLVPQGFEILTEFLLVPLNSGDSFEAGDVFKNVYVWNSSSGDHMKCVQFDRFYAPAAAPNLVKFSENLLQGNSDNFFAIPGTTIPIDKATLTDVVTTIRNMLAKECYLECVSKDIKSEKIYHIEDNFKSTDFNSWMDCINSTDSLYHQVEQHSTSGDYWEFMQPLLENRFDDKPSNEYDGKIRRSVRNTWIPYRTPFLRRRSI